jgi:hypothetical protein
MNNALPTPMIRGKQVWLRAMEHRDLEAFALDRNDGEMVDKRVMSILREEWKELSVRKAGSCREC